MKPVHCPKGSVPVDFLHPKFRVAHPKHDVISILMIEYNTYTNMYIIKKIISYKFILCWYLTALLKLKVIPGEAGSRTDFFQIWNNN